MLHDLERRLSLIFDRGADGSDEPGTLSGAPVPYPLVDFVAYAEDCVLSGRVRLQADRLSDMLNEHEELHLVDIMVQSLVEPETVEAKEVIVPRDELLLVHATGPRGDQARRRRTLQTFVAINAGPYAVRGNLHGFPGVDPIAGIHRRRPMIPLTDVVVDYMMGGQPERHRIGSVIMNRRAIDFIVQTREDDRALTDYPPPDETGPPFDDFAAVLARAARSSP